MISFDEIFDQYTRLLKALCQAIRKSENLWYTAAMDYASKYAGSQDYSKNVKRSYYKNADICRCVARDLEQQPIPRTMEELSGMIEKIQTDISQLPVHWSDRETMAILKRRLHTLLGQDPD